MLPRHDYERRALPEFDLVLHGDFRAQDVRQQASAIAEELTELRERSGLPRLADSFIQTRLWDGHTSFLIPALMPPHDSLTLQPGAGGCELLIPSWGFLSRRRMQDERFLAFAIACMHTIWDRLGALRIAFGVSGRQTPTSGWFTIRDPEWERELALYLVTFHCACRSTLAEAEVRKLLAPNP